MTRPRTPMRSSRSSRPGRRCAPSSTGSPRASRRTRRPRARHRIQIAAPRAGAAPPVRRYTLAPVAAPLPLNGSSSFAGERLAICEGGDVAAALAARLEAEGAAVRRISRGERVGEVDGFVDLSRAAGAAGAAERSPRCAAVRARARGGPRGRAARPRRGAARRAGGAGRAREDARRRAPGRRGARRRARRPMRTPRRSCTASCTRRIRTSRSCTAAAGARSSRSCRRSCRPRRPPATRRSTRTRSCSSPAVRAASPRRSRSRWRGATAAASSSSGARRCRAPRIRRSGRPAMRGRCARCSASWCRRRPRSSSSARACSPTARSARRCPRSRRSAIARATTPSTCATPAFGALIDELYRRHGRLDGVIHGAGVLEDKLLRHKTPESFERVFETKVAGARTLVERLRRDVRFVVLFSSVSGAFGNRGQIDYAAANDALDKLAASLARELPGRVVSIDWGPWGGTGMVSPELEREYARRGIGLIDPERGVEALLAELHGGRGDAQVILTARIRARSSGGGAPDPRTSSMREPVAIVGMGAVFPGAPDLGAYAANLERGVDAITEPSRPDRASIRRTRGAFYCGRGGFIDAGRSIRSRSASCRAPRPAPSRTSCSRCTSPRARSTTPAAPAPRDRAGVILGRGGYLTPGMARLVEPGPHRRAARGHARRAAARARRRHARPDPRRVPRARAASSAPTRRSAWCRTSRRRGSRTGSTCAARRTPSTPRAPARCSRSTTAAASSPTGAATSSSPAACTSATTSRSGACSTQLGALSHSVGDPPVRPPRRRHPDRRGRGRRRAEAARRRRARRRSRSTR